MSFTHDARGNLTSDGVKSYGYDYLNRLTSASGAAAFVYDASGRLYQSGGNGQQTRRYLYDGDTIIAEYDGANNLLRRYVHGPGVDEPLVWYEGSGTSDKRWLIADERGSIIAVTNSEAAVIGSVNKYDEYGIPDAANSGRFGYTGQAWLPEAGLYHYKARAYAPTLGRFLQADPIGFAAGDMNLYAYVGGDPVNAADPSGLSECLPDEICVTPPDPSCWTSSFGCYFPDTPQPHYDPLPSAPAEADAVLQPTMGTIGRLIARAMARAALASRVIVPAAKVKQVADRGWSMRSIRQTISNPTRIGDAVNRANGNSATAYFQSRNQYVVVDDVTNQIVQVSDLRDPRWIVDDVIVNIRAP